MANGSQSPDLARQPGLATLSVIVHSESEDIAPILELLARGMRSFDKATAKYWSGLVEIGLPALGSRLPSAGTTAVVRPEEGRTNARLPPSHHAEARQGGPPLLASPP